MPNGQLSAYDPLVIRALEGDRHAFQSLVDQYQDGVFRLVFSRIQSRMDAQDLSQEIFLTAMKKMGTLKSPDKFKSWLYRIAVNKVRDHLRKKKFMALFTPFISDDNKERQPVNQPSGYSYTQEEMTGPHRKETAQQEDRLHQKEFWEHVKQMTLELSAMESEVFMLRFFDQQELADIAAILNKGESTVKTHLYRALKKIRNHPGKGVLLEGRHP